MDKKQTIGIRVVDSCHISSRLRITPSAYFTPIDSAMYLRACGSTRSGHQDLKMCYSYIEISMSQARCQNTPNEQQLSECV